MIFILILTPTRSSLTQFGRMRSKSFGQISYMNLHHGLLESSILGSLAQYFTRRKSLTGYGDTIYLSPDLGSVTPKHAFHSPLINLGNMLLRWSSLANLATGCVAYTFA